MLREAAVLLGRETKSKNNFAELVYKTGLNQHALFSLLHFDPNDVIVQFGSNKIYSKPNTFTIQIDKNKHISLRPNCLAYTNHSCDPNVFFNTHTFELIAIKNIFPGDELCFFYPSTELEMASPFECRCGSAFCIGEIKGARYIEKEILKNYKLTTFVHQSVFTD